MKVVVSILLLIGIIVAILALCAWLVLLCLWFMFFSDNKEYYPDIKDL